jgi:hypothetical protein
MAEFHSSIQELISASSATSTAANFITSINELAQASDSLAGSPLWEVINTSESTTWSTINTSDTGGWQVIKTQP